MPKEKINEQMIENEENKLDPVDEDEDIFENEKMENVRQSN